MRYFDLAGIEVDSGLAARLGFRKVFTIGKEVDIVADHLPGNRKAIVYSGNPGTLAKSLRNRNVVGIMVEQSTLMKKVIEEVRLNGKLLVLNASELTAVSPPERLRNLHRLRKLFQFATHMHADVVLVTLASEREYLLSSMQLLEIARLIGAKDGGASRAVSNIGRLDDTKKEV